MVQVVLLTHQYSCRGRLQSDTRRNKSLDAQTTGMYLFLLTDVKLYMELIMTSALLTLSLFEEKGEGGLWCALLYEEKGEGGLCN